MGSDATANKPSVLEQLKKLQEEHDKIMDAAKNEILAKVELAIAELKELGLDYRFVEGKAVRTPNPEHVCPICLFRTTPPHDRRKHRNQKPQKPFSDWDLQQLKLTKVALQKDKE
jgi:hypothetical protein